MANSYPRLGRWFALFMKGREMRSARLACALTTITLSMLGGSANAQQVTFEFPASGQLDLITDTITDAGSGLELTINNPRDNARFGNNFFGYLLGGLFIDGGLAPTVSLTFSQNVRLLSYTIVDTDPLSGFDIRQGNTESLDQPTDALGTFSFTNTEDVFRRRQPIALISGDNNAAGFAIADITVELVPAEPCPADIADDFGFAGGDDQVSFGDFLFALTVLGPCPGGAPGCDFDIADDFGFAGPDGQVSFGDFLFALSVLGPCP